VCACAQGTRTEELQKAVRYYLKKSGIPVESSKGEFGRGQHELNVAYSDILTMADNHVLYKQCFKVSLPRPPPPPSCMSLACVFSHNTT
jgi:glutamine synthetase